MRIGALSICLLAIAACAPAETPPAGPIVRVLGTVQDGGLPHAACDCDRCERARRNPSGRRYVASIAVIFPEQDLRWLIDATPDIRPQLHALEVTGRRPVDGVLLTHAHIGHYLGLAFFGFEAAHTDRVPVYCSSEMAEFLKTNAPWDQLVRLKNIELRSVVDGEIIVLHPELSATPVPVPHRDEYADTIGFILRGPRRSLLYVPDTDGWDRWEPPLTEMLDGIDIAILDGTFYSLDELPGRDISAIGHPLIESSIDLLQSLVKEGRLEVYFTHLNHSNPALDSDGEEIREIRERGFDILREGQEFPL
jgi:pyrroloquinoline quinone biosynthesis protein B